MPAKRQREQVQADEIRVKGPRLIRWMAMALMVSTRLWRGGVVSEHRDRQRADHLLAMVKACGLLRCALLVFTEGGVGVSGQDPARLLREGEAQEKTGTQPVADVAGDRAWYGNPRTPPKGPSSR